MPAAALVLALRTAMSWPGETGWPLILPRPTLSRRLYGDGREPRPSVSGAPAQIPKKDFEVQAAAEVAADAVLAATISPSDVRQLQQLAGQPGRLGRRPTASAQTQATALRPAQRSPADNFSRPANQHYCRRAAAASLPAQDRLANRPQTFQFSSQAASASLPVGQPNNPTSCS